MNTKRQDSLWLYESVQRMNLKPTEELFYSFLIKKSFYEFKDFCSDVLTDKDGAIDWFSIKDEFEHIPIVVYCKYQTNKFQQYIEDKLGISRMSFFRILKSLQGKGILTRISYESINHSDDVIALFKDDYLNAKMNDECYVLDIDFDNLAYSKYRYIYLEKPLLKSPKLLYFYSWMLDHYNYWDKQGKKFMTSAEHLAEEYGLSYKVFRNMVAELKEMGYIRKEYKKEWNVIMK